MIDLVFGKGLKLVKRNSIDRYEVPIWVTIQVLIGFLEWDIARYEPSMQPVG